MTNPNKLADAQIRLIRDLTDAFDECEKVAPVYDCRDNSGEPYPSQWLADVRVRAAKFLAEHDAQPASGEFLPSSEQPPFAGIVGCRPLERAPQPAPAPVQVGTVYAVPTGVPSEDGKHETYTIHDAPVPMADNWKLHTAHPHAPAADGAGELVQLERYEYSDMCDCMAVDPSGEWVKYDDARAAIAALRQPVPDAVDLEQFRGAVSLLHLTCRRRIRDVRKGVFPAHYLSVFEQDLAQASALLDLIASQQESRNASDWVYKIAAAITEQQESRNAD
jgi:hypothetical protein